MEKPVVHLDFTDGAKFSGYAVETAEGFSGFKTASDLLKKGQVSGVNSEHQIGWIYTPNE